MTTPNLRAVPSTGAPKPQLMRHDDGTYEEYRRRPRPCGGCGFASEPLQLMTWYEGGWWHIACARESLANRPESAAWFALAEQIARRPSVFKASEIKVVTNKLLDIARGPLDGDPS